MKNLYPKVAFALFAGLTFFACSSNDNNDSNSVATKKQVIENYSNIVYANYKQAYDDAVLLETAIKTFTTTPTDANFTAAKNAWKVSRESYGTTEAFRFANGPIDGDETGPEGLLNSWPLDENFIDYVDGNTNAGIINDLVEFPVINKSLLEGLNEDGGEKNISVGYHAIEFLLWGQDLTAPSAKLPGQRKFTDYVTGATGTAANQGRRADYLKACADLLTDNLDYLVQQWKSGGTYRTKFLALPEDTAIKNIYLGITTLVTAELPIERMEVALENADQEDEHSCFSDNTHRDIALNLQGVINVYQGKYANVEGPSLEDLVKQADAATYDETLTSLNSSTTKVAAILTPFDLAISGGPDSSEGAKVKTAVQQLLNFGATLLKGASKIGVTVNG
ncbi:putative iron-regulated protein [Flavobacterium sp. 9]|uniref:imelysin family protein n=1 Tax=Flavobacterium sp. 9 TaxID=2035198 RepID=UPI000C191F61|nr:imelysin family protein [Flavobacterium sp. 9]PIF32027.1 putative iron-regulated protein [Flavobacterium sp. 9]